MDVIKKEQMQQHQEQILIDWYQQNIDQLETLFTHDQMLAYNGEYCIGRLKNINQLSFLKTSNPTSVTIV